MLWIIFSVMAAFFWSIVNVLDKFMLDKWYRRPEAMMAFYGMLNAISVTAVWLYGLVGTISIFNIVLGLVVGFLYTLIAYMYYHIVTMDEISRIAPLFYLVPFFILVVAAVVLGELLSLGNYIGVVLLVFGAMMISTRSLRRPSFGRSFWYLILLNVVMTITSVGTKYMLGFSDVWTVFFYTRSAIVIGCIPFMVMMFPEIRRVFRKHGKRSLGMATLNEGFSLSGHVFFIMATALGSVTLVNAISSIQPFFVLGIMLLISSFWPHHLKEDIGKGTVAVCDEVALRTNQGNPVT